MRLYSLALAGVASLSLLLLSGALTPHRAEPDEPVLQSAMLHGLVPLDRIAEARRGDLPLVAAELITSQGCSSCPPADAIAAGLAQDPNVLLISRPVTYWDRLGWKDTLARPANTALQRAYATTGRGEVGVYTPQLVVAGREAVIGSRQGQVRELIERELAQTLRGDIRVMAQTEASGDVLVKLSGKRPARAEPARLSLVALSRMESVQVGSGENGGRTLHYANVLVDERPLGNWAGGEISVTVGRAQMAVPGADRYALIAREGVSGPILAAAWLR